MKRISLQEQINDLNNLANEERLLNEKYMRHALENAGIYEEQTKYFKPIIDEFKNLTTEVQKVTQPTLPSTNSLALEQKQPQTSKTKQLENYFSNPTDEQKELIDTFRNCMSAPGKRRGGLDTFVFSGVSDDGKLQLKNNEKIIYLTKDFHVTDLNQNINFPLSEGLIKLLLSHNTYSDKIHNITSNDIKAYQQLIGKDLGTKKYKHYDNLKVGEGVIFLPSNVKELNKRLKVLVAAYKEGHKDPQSGSNFVDIYNEINGILKELLNKKEINEKQYLFFIKHL